MHKFTKIENNIIKKYILDSNLSDSLNSIRRVMESIWANDAPRIVQNFTDHGIEHSERVADYVEKLLQANLGTKFTEKEIYLLLAGVYLHDIGMQCDIVKYPEIKEIAKNLGAEFKEAFTATTTNGYSLEEQKEIRENHHYLSAAWIDYLYKGNDPVALSNGIKSVPFDLISDLMDVCKFHSKLSISKCPDFFNGDPRSRKKMVAAFLRFADELDINSTRVKMETVKIFSIDPKNSVYWWLHNYTKIDFIDSNIIRLKVDLHPEDFKTYGSFILNEYIINFKNKNQPILNVLVGKKIPVVIDDNSDVVSHNHAEKFPPEITAALDKMIELHLTDNSRLDLGRMDNETGIKDSLKSITKRGKKERLYETKRLASEESRIRVFRKIWHKYHVTTYKGNSIWRYTLVDFTNASIPGYLNTDVKIISPEINEQYLNVEDSFSEEKLHYNIEAGVRGNKLIMISNAAEGDDTGIFIYPTIDHNFSPVYCGISCIKTWDKTPSISPTILADKPKYGENPTITDATLIKQMDEFWKSYMKQLRYELLPKKYKN